MDSEDEGTVWSVGEITLCYPLASEVSESICPFALCSIPASFYPFYIFSLFFKNPFLNCNVVLYRTLTLHDF